MDFRVKEYLSDPYVCNDNNVFYYKGMIIYGRRT